MIDRQTGRYTDNRDQKHFCSPQIIPDKNSSKADTTRGIARYFILLLSHKILTDQFWPLSVLIAWPKNWKLLSRQLDIKFQIIKNNPKKP